MQSKATTVKQYLAELPDDRREAISKVRKLVLDNLDRDFEEGMQYGMIGFYVPHRIYPPGYHCDPNQPLPFACLASQKNYMSLYMMCLYGEGSDEKRFRDEWAKTGKKLDMGKSCIRFKKLDDLALEVVASAIKRVTVKSYIAHYESVIKTSRKSTSTVKTKTAGSKKPAKAVSSKKVSKPVASMKTTKAPKKTSTKSSPKSVGQK